MGDARGEGHSPGGLGSRWIGMVGPKSPGDMGARSPSTRKGLHIRHHRILETEGDLEERAISNGERWGVRRFFVIADGPIGSMLHLPRGNLKLARAVAKATAKAYFTIPCGGHSSLFRSRRSSPR